jgi:hypothetical protein
MPPSNSAALSRRVGIDLVAQVTGDPSVYCAGRRKRENVKYVIGIVYWGSHRDCQTVASALVPPTPSKLPAGSPFSFGQCLCVFLLPLCAIDFLLFPFFSFFASLERRKKNRRRRKERVESQRRSLRDE